MRNKWMIVGVIVLIINLLAVNQKGVRAESAWKQIVQFKINHPTGAVGFISETNGVTVGSFGECHYSTDGGKTWPAAQNSSACRIGIDFLNKEHLWNCGDGSDVRRSDDGGRIWTAVTNAIAGNFIRFINEQSGWIANQTQLVATKDGGKTWNIPKAPTKTIIAISPISEKEGYILDSDNILYFSGDAGQTWRSHKVNTKDAFIMPYLRFFDAKRAVLIGFSVKQKKELIMTTSDGGDTWDGVIIADRLSRAYLSPDGKFLTLFNLDNIVTVFKHQ